MRPQEMAEKNLYGGEEDEVIRFMGKKFLATVKFQFQNARSLLDDQFRNEYFRKCAETNDIVGLAGTWCPDDLTAKKWSAEWKGGNVFYSIDNQNRRGRGMCIFISNEIPEADKARNIYDDPEGRCLAVRLNLHLRDTVLICIHADNKSDADQTNFYKRIMTGAPQMYSYLEISITQRANSLTTENITKTETQTHSCQKRDLEDWQRWMIS